MGVNSVTTKLQSNTLLILSHRLSHAYLTETIPTIMATFLYIYATEGISIIMCFDHVCV